MHRAFSSVSAAIDVALEANVRNLPTLLARENGQCLSFRAENVRDDRLRHSNNGRRFPSTRNGVFLKWKPPGVRCRSRAVCFVFRGFR